MKEVALLLREKGCTAFPVSDGGSLKGIISRRDFKRAKKQSDMDSPVKAFMSRNIIHITTEQSVTEATRLMVKHNIGRLPVLDDQKLIGIITRSDIMRYYYDILPE
jgi:tRNA nucleotidyltransferase (CCA-adding enzyme)